MRRPKPSLLRFGMLLVLAGCIAAPEATWLRDSIGIIGYSVTLPPNYNPSTKYPLFFYLHSAGTSATEDGSWPHNNENEGDCKRLASDANQATYPCIVYAPQTPKYSQGEHWVNLPGSSPADANWDYGTYSVNTTPQSTCMRDALRGLDTMIARYSVDTNRIYIGGGSMGGYGTYDVLCRGYAGRFACALPVSGGGDTSKAKNFKNLPLWAFADSEDNIIPFRFQVQMVEALKKAGGSPKYSFYSNETVENSTYPAKMGGHIWNIPFELDAQIMPWIFAQSKTSTQNTTSRPGHASTTSVHRARTLVNTSRTGAGISIRFQDRRQQVTREFDARGRPHFVRPMAR